ncbi:hypothetical protein OG763_03455 [Streptomyces sp. NBC_01230]|uniref:hypothetical protein n=1 Tax=Streptomyces sp. NBC_01230 TaxID=2903784 RepID=UPI002E1125F7|nr:hypothetical protein OG763_03455 [Streptomyces sp. NBC_01230]
MKITVEVSTYRPGGLGPYGRPGRGCTPGRPSRDQDAAFALFRAVAESDDTNGTDD